MKIMALKGYYKARYMETRDYFDIGVRFMRANDGRLPTRAAYTLLAQTLRTPGPNAIRDKFGWEQYLERIQAEYEKQLRQMDQRSKDAAKRAVAGDKLPSFILRNESPREITFQAAKWALITELAPRIDPVLKELIVKYVPENNFEAAIKSVCKVDSYDIQDAAEKLKITNKLWPTAPAKQWEYLKVPEELLGPRT